MNANWIFGIVAFLLISGLIMHFALAGVMERLGREPMPSDRWAAARSGRESALAQTNFPRLQIVPAEDLRRFRAREELELNSYGWIDRTAGVARIPIARAMELLLRRGLPVRAGANENSTGPSSYQLQLQRVPEMRRSGAESGGKE